METIAKRDVSEKKLSTSAGLKIDFKKFSGYDSPMDIYTFKNDFKKFIEPFIQKSLWGDYLKKNCLSGAALNLVVKIDDVDEIWKKLTEVYGDASLMLQKKLLSLEKLTNMEKIKDDAKLLGCLTTLLNTMTELSNLATDFKLENELYYGVGLQKILDLIGIKGRRKFVKSIAQDKVEGKAKWDKLVGFLKADLKVREALVLDEKISKCAGPESREKEKPKDNTRQSSDNQGGKSGGDNKSNSFTNNHDSASSPSAACSLCGKDQDHVISFRPDKSAYVEYIACKIFADKTPKERDNFLFKKHYCNKCLTPGVKFGSKHDCDTKFVCPQKFMKNGAETECKKTCVILWSPL